MAWLLPARQRGLSLLEVLVMMTIVAVLVAALTLSMDGSASRQLENAARRAQQLIQLACERANASASDIGIAVQHDALRFGFLDALGWHALDATDSSDPLRARKLADAVTLTVSRDGQRLTPAAEPPRSAQLACLGSGEMTPFELEFSSDATPERWQLTGRFDQSLELSRDDHVR